MTKWNKNNENYIFTTTVIPSHTHQDEFFLELFSYTPELDCDGIPTRVLNNFDDLIRFFEE